MTTTPLGARWLGSPNLTPGRAGHSMAIPPAYVVLHTMVGTLGSANGRFQQASEQASATYGIGLNGSIVQWVDEDDAAWANGATGQGGRGDNLDSISIEHEDAGDYNGPRTPALYATSSRLVRDICQRYGIPIDRQHVLKHLECAGAATSCPDGLDVDGIVRQAAALNAPPAPVPPPPALPKEVDMLVIVVPERGTQFLLSGSLYVHILPGTDVALGGAKVPAIEVSGAQHDAWLRATGQAVPTVTPPLG